MSMATTSAERILSLDVIRGVAVMGIFSVNIVGMAMIESAYFYPPRYGFNALGDRIMWAANFLIVDGRFRALFSMLFGASLVLVCERALASGTSAWKVHYPRMVVLLGFGCAHYYLLWWGDILANYALVGMVAFAFWRLPARWLLPLSLLALALYYGPAITFGGQQIAQLEAGRSPDATPEQRAALAEVVAELSTPEAEIAEAKAGHASIPAHVAYVTEQNALRPFTSMFGYGLETLGLMLFGMASYRSGFLTGSWSRRSYVQVAVVCIGASLLYHGVGTWRILETNFDPFTYYPWNRIWSGPLHPIGAIGYAALVMLLFRPGSGMTDQVAAVGRTAFSNYLGATIIGAVLFFGFGLRLYGEVSRGEAWLFVPLVWALMLLWSKWWLDRYRYGPLEWVWRCLSRWQFEPMRRRSPLVFEG
jgi:uncharacterized protein